MSETEPYSDLRDEGYLYASIDSAHRTAEIDDLQVYPNARGGGIGSALLSALIRHCSNMQIHQISAVLNPWDGISRADLQAF